MGHEVDVAPMGVRPPSGDDEEPAVVEFGIAAVDAQLRSSTLSFPATRSEVSEALGEERVPYDASGNDVALETVLADLDDERFESRQELLNALHPHFEDYRERHGGGIVAAVRSVLPF